MLFSPESKNPLTPKQLKRWSWNLYRLFPSLWYSSYILVYIYLYQMSWLFKSNFNVWLLVHKIIGVTNGRSKHNQGGLVIIRLSSIVRKNLSKDMVAKVYRRQARGEVGSEMTENTKYNRTRQGSPLDDGLTGAKSTYCQNTPLGKVHILTNPLFYIAKHFFLIFLKNYFEHTKWANVL